MKTTTINGIKITDAILNTLDGWETNLKDGTLSIYVEELSNIQDLLIHFLVSEFLDINDNRRKDILNALRVLSNLKLDFKEMIPNTDLAQNENL
jgi:hypothetical protein